MFAECADAVIWRIPGQDSRRNWKQKKFKCPPLYHPPPPTPSSAGTNAPRNTGPEPTELGITRRRTLTKEEYQELWAKNACVYCRKPNASHMARDCPLKKKRPGNGGSH